MVSSLSARIAAWLASGLGGRVVAANDDDDDAQDQSMRRRRPRSEAAARSGWTFQGESSLCDALRVENFEGAQVRIRMRVYRDREVALKASNAGRRKKKRFFSLDFRLISICLIFL